ncbi:MAG: K(+)-stimulated pyrophosphate-energized sodium pump [Abditibacteriota bacterium]|nr:K(+)-stimulated pyrophosphate-energized sodium pump [Abditibacteriota bacterium]
MPPRDPANPASPSGTEQTLSQGTHSGSTEAVAGELFKQLGSGEWRLLWLVLASGLFALGCGLWMRARILTHSDGTPAMREVAAAIQDGSRAYLKRQFQTLFAFLLALTVILYFVYRPVYGSAILAGGVAGAFFAGALSSYLAGYIGMMLAVQGNVRVAAGALRSYKQALEIAFQSGAVAGLMTVGLGLCGAVTIFMVFRENAMKVLVGYGFGCALVALFMRIGGGIYTKAADVGADLVGKVEVGIPEDDPRNAATIADNVGDNVGDCAGMAADVFESYVMTLIAAIILSAGVLSEAANNATLQSTLGGAGGIDRLALNLAIFPLLVNAVGVFASVAGIFCVRGRDDMKFDPMTAIGRGFRIAAALSIVGFGLIAFSFLTGFGIEWWRFFAATLMGVVLAIAIERLTDYFTATQHAPVNEIAQASRTGPATLILSGIAFGLEAAVWQAIAIGITVLISYALFPGSLALAAYGVALSGIGLLTTTGFILAMDTFGPISDNANGIFEMSGALHNSDDTGEQSTLANERAGRIVARLDAVGNTTKALTKGFAIATAVIAALSLFGSFKEAVSEAQIRNGVDASLRLATTGIQIDRTDIFIGFLLGGAVPFLFSSFAIRAVGRSAFQIVQEVRRQFREHPGIMTYEEKPDYARCVDIVTSAAQRELLAPALLAIGAPIGVGFGLGAGALGGFLAGAILTGQLLAVFMSTSGGAGDNAKKAIEDGLLGGKGTDCHKASVIGDTVGDPFKDTAGPALNPLIKVMNLVAILIAPLVVAPLQMGTKVGITGAMIGVMVLAVTLNKRGGRDVGAGDANALPVETAETVIAG